MKAGTRLLGAVALLGSTLLAGTSAASAAAPATTVATTASDPQISDQQIMDAFRDEWGQDSFEPTGITDWEPLATWERAAQYAFAPGTDERTARPVKETGLAPLRLDIVTRKAHDETQYEVTETADHADGTQTVNPFPVFSGTPQSMEFFNAAGIPGLPVGEIQQNCRDFVKAQRHFLLCRMIPSDGSIHYQVKIESGSPATGLPSAEQVLNAFRDQWGIDTFTPSGATAWRPISQWSRFRQFTFPEGTDEFTGTPTEDAVLRPFTVSMESRTVDGTPQFVESSQVVLEDGTTRDDGFEFGRFTGDATDWFEYEAATIGVPNPGAEYQLHRKVITVDGQDFLVVRVILPPVDTRADISYYVMRSIG